MNTLTAIRSILKKDLRSLSPLVLITICLLVFEVAFGDVEVLDEYTKLIQAYLPVISSLACGLLVIIVFQLDPSTSFTHDWLTRPIKKRDLLFSKIIFLIATIIIPLVIAKFIVGLSNGHSITESLSNATIINNYWLLLTYVVVLCVAVLCKSVIETLGALFGIVVAGLLATIMINALFITNPENAINGETFSGLLWIESIAIIVIFSICVPLICWFQYKKRQEAAARSIFATACILSIAIFFAAFYGPSWKMIYGIQQVALSDFEKSDINSLILDYAYECFNASTLGGSNTNSNKVDNPQDDRARSQQLIGARAWNDRQLRMAGQGATIYSTTVTGRGLPKDWRIVALKTTATYTNSQSKSTVKLSPSNASSVYRNHPYKNTATHYWLASNTETEQLSSDPSVELDLDYYLAILAPHTYELKMDGVRRKFPKLGYCSAAKDTIKNQAIIDCFKRGSQPTLVSVELKDVPASRIDIGVPNYSPDWVQFLSGRQFETVIPALSLVNHATVVITAYETKTFVKKQMNTPGFLGGSASKCPLPAPSKNFAQTSWSDTSPHEASFVGVEDGVNLEVLDWGGPANSNEFVETLVLLAGLSGTAHSYDDFAPILAKRYRVIGITRRGFGASSKPNYGYDINRISEDVIRVLDSLDIETPILVGHSMAGDELSTLAVEQPNRFKGLVYLDAAYDRSIPNEKVSGIARSLPPAPRANKSDLVSYKSIKKHFERLGSGIPEGEVLARFSFSDGRRSYDERHVNALMAGIKKPKYQNITTPALAIYAVDTSPEQLMRPWYNQNEPGLRKNVKRYFQLRTQEQSKHIENFREKVINGKVIVLENADHSVFISNPNEVISAINTFVSELK